MNVNELIKTYDTMIIKAKTELQKTDYKAIKFAEGELSEADFAPIRAERRAWREEINKLEAKIAVLRS